MARSAGSPRRRRAARRSSGPTTDVGDLGPDRGTGHDGPGQWVALPPHRAGPGEPPEQAVGRTGHRIHVDQHQGDPVHHGGQRRRQAGVPTHGHHDPGPGPPDHAEAAHQGDAEPGHRTDVVDQGPGRDLADDAPPGQEGGGEAAALEGGPVLAALGADELDGVPGMPGRHQRFGDGQGRLQVAGGSTPGHQGEALPGHRGEGRRRGGAATGAMRSCRAMLTRMPTAAMVMISDEPP